MAQFENDDDEYDPAADDKLQEKYFKEFIKNKKILAEVEGVLEEDDEEHHPHEGLDEDEEEEANEVYGQAKQFAVPKAQP